MTHAARPTSGRSRPRGRPGFTLVELMISIALVLLLILGVNQVFQATSQAVGTGEAINSALRDGRAVQSTLAADLAGVVPNGPADGNAPFLAIRSAAAYAYNDPADLAADRDGYPQSIDLNVDGREGDPAVPGEIIAPFTYNGRNHRLDTFGFFARGPYQRQTGNDGTAVANQTADEAFCSYGHLWLPDNAGAFGDPTNAATSTYPAAGTPAANPNNYFANRFTLGRFALLLARPTSNAAGTSALYDISTPPVVQTFVAAINDPGASGWFSPLFARPDASPGASASYSVASGVTASDGSTRTLATLTQSRFDLAGTTTSDIHRSLTSALNGATAYDDTWWRDLVGLGVPALPNLAAEPARFQCDPFASRPLSAAALAQAAPYLVRGCSQFTVEYAGDFVTQENNTAYATTTPNPAYARATYLGDTISAGPDGTLDYTLVPPTPGSTISRTIWQKQVRWYGLPRNTSGRLGITPANGDVVPVRDYVQHLATGTPTTTPMPWEKTVPNYQTDYAPQPPVAVSGPPAPSEVYTCVFGPNDPAPKLIRITITVADPTGRLPEGQTYQYVYAVPAP